MAHVHEHVQDQRHKEPEEDLPPAACVLEEHRQQEQQGCHGRAGDQQRRREDVVPDPLGQRGLGHLRHLHVLSRGVREQCGAEVVEPPEPPDRGEGHDEEEGDPRAHQNPPLRRPVTGCPLLDDAAREHKGRRAQQEENSLPLDQYCEPHAQAKKRRVLETGKSITAQQEVQRHGDHAEQREVEAQGAEAAVDGRHHHQQRRGQEPGQAAVTEPADLVDRHEEDAEVDDVAGPQRHGRGGEDPAEEDLGEVRQRDIVVIEEPEGAEDLLQAAE